MLSPAIPMCRTASRPDSGSITRPFAMTISYDAESAREHATLYGSASVLADAIARRIDRASGLREALWRSN